MEYLLFDQSHLHEALASAKSGGWLAVHTSPDLYRGSLRRWLIKAKAYLDHFLGYDDHTLAYKQLDGGLGASVPVVRRIADNEGRVWIEVELADAYGLGSGEWAWLPVDAPLPAWVMQFASRRNSAVARASFDHTSVLEGEAGIRSPQHSDRLGGQYG